VAKLAAAEGGTEILVSGVRNLGPEDDFNGGIEREFIGSHGDPRMLPGVPEDVGEEHRGGVQDKGVIDEAGGRLHIAFEANDLFDEIERSDQGFDLGEGVEERLARGMSSCFDREFGTEFSLEGEFLAHKRELTARDNHISESNGGNVGTDGGGSHREFQSKLSDLCVNVGISHVKFLVAECFASAEGEIREFSPSSGPFSIKKAPF